MIGNLLLGPATLGTVLIKSYHHHCLRIGGFPIPCNVCPFNYFSDWIRGRCPNGWLAYGGCPFCHLFPDNKLITGVPAAVTPSCNYWKYQQQVYSFPTVPPQGKWSITQFPLKSVHVSMCWVLQSNRHCLKLLIALDHRSRPIGPWLFLTLGPPNPFSHHHLFPFLLHPSQTVLMTQCDDRTKQFCHGFCVNSQQKTFTKLKCEINLWVANRPLEYRHCPAPWLPPIYAAANSSF